MSIIAARHRQAEQRKGLLQRFCNELCASAEIARSDVVTGFFWPDDDHGSVVAPDGSMASMTGAGSDPVLGEPDVPDSSWRGD